MDMLKLLVVAGDSGWDSDSFADITSGLALGILVRHIDTEPEEPNVLWSFVAKNNVDLFGGTEADDGVTFADSTLMFTFKMCPAIATVNITDKKFLEVVIRDNLSSLAKVRAFVFYGAEVVSA